MKRAYATPLILKAVDVEIETDILIGSVVTPETKVQTTGQEVVSYDFSSPSFNQSWESGTLE